VNTRDEYAIADRFDYSQWKRMLKYVTPYRKEMIALLLAAVITAFFDALFPLMTRYAISHFIEGATLNGMGMFAFVFVILAMCQTIFNVIYSKKSIVIEMGIGRDMKEDLFRHVQELSLDYFNRTPVGFILARITSDTDSMGAIFSWRLSDFVFNLAYILFAAANMIALNPLLAFIVILSMPVLFIIANYFQRKLLVANREVRRQNSRVTTSYNENINGAVTIKELDARDKVDADFAALNRRLKDSSYHAKAIENLFSSLIMVVGCLALSVVLGLGPGMVDRRVLDVRTLSVFISYTFNLLNPIESLTRGVTQVISLQANVERVNRLIDTRPTVSDRRDVAEKYGTIYSPRKENWEPIRGDIEFRNVSFRYPDSDVYVLEHFNLKIPAGTCIAIVGATGAGKSTLVNLVCRFFEPTSGQILIDGIDYRERSYLWLESNLSYILQTPHLFSGTIAQNIRYANRDATMEEIIEAAKLANAYDFITRLPDGFDTDVGQGGDKLSTGQKQLISIARALLAKGKILVMDEATSSVDTKTEMMINSMTGDLLKDRTSFIIAHRLSTVKNADMIIVVDEGKITEMGTHAELLRREGQYYRMYTGQWEEKAQNEYWESIHSSASKETE
jgi:ATP-binding cassette subfamily B protein